MKVLGAIFGACFVFLGALLWIVILFIVLVGAIGVLRIVIDNVFECNSLEVARKLKMRGLLDERDKSNHRRNDTGK